MKFDKKTVKITYASGACEGKRKKTDISWSFGGVEYEGETLGGNSDTPDEITGTYEKGGQTGHFQYDVVQELEDPKIKKDDEDKHKKKKEAANKKIVANAGHGKLWAETVAKLGGGQWTDPDFPPKENSIGNVRVNGKVPSWKRASDIFGSAKIFEDGISPHDIQQGALGDCYFLAALAALAEHPEFISAIFTSPDNKNGCYSMTFYPRGIKTEVLVDDFIPVGPDGRPCFSRTHGSELWVLLLEKAYSKCYGSYKNIAGGYPHQALFELTGAPYSSYDLKTGPDYIFTKLEQADKAKYMMQASTPGTDSGNFQSADTGLCAGHAYSVLDARTYQGNKLVHIRNPWGNTEWTGPWNDRDTGKWTPQAKKELGWVDANDGAYWMDLASFSKYFQRVTISTTDLSSHFASVGLNMASGKTHTITMDVPQAGLVITPSVTQGRVHEPAMVPCHITIVSGGKQIYTPKAFEDTYHCCPGPITLGPAGSYTVTVTGYPNQKKSHPGSFSVVSAVEVKLSGGDYAGFQYTKGGKDKDKKDKDKKDKDDKDKDKKDKDKKEKDKGDKDKDKKDKDKKDKK